MRTTAASITLLTTSLMAALGPLIVGFASDRLMHAGFDNVSSLRYGAIGLAMFEVAAVLAFVKCGASLPGDFSRDRSAEAGAPDPTGEDMTAIKAPRSEPEPQGSKA
jgi:hypothetical protein